MMIITSSVIITTQSLARLLVAKTSMVLTPATAAPVHQNSRPVYRTNCLSGDWLHVVVLFL